MAGGPDDHAPLAWFGPEDADLYLGAEGVELAAVVPSSSRVWLCRSCGARGVFVHMAEWVPDAS